MMLINPMWDNESERIGKRECTPLGYALHVISDLIGFLGLLSLLGAGVYLGYRNIVDTSHVGVLWILAVPFALAFTGSALYRCSWMLAHKHGFRYDHDSGEASWIEQGERRMYKWKA